MNSQKETPKLMKKNIGEEEKNMCKLQIVPYSQIHDHIVETKKFNRKKPSQKLKAFLYFYNLTKRNLQTHEKK